MGYTLYDIKTTSSVRCYNHDKSIPGYNALNFNCLYYFDSAGFGDQLAEW